ncbi:hypothetical protein F511_25818 [Dorcoceras hygrometricum]|uniref:Uncharacterized protein n=1 Tax=Dorcoceras hygrometricum TaxID=472368 RepID=A0A2Z7BUT7_9LAMI|nr:hypothetical protein F511_25818 [Dorcoceras hygrometricum]
MAIPLVFQAKAMSIRLLLTALAFVFAATLFMYFDKVKISSTSTQSVRNQTLVLGNKFGRRRIPGGSMWPEISVGDGCYDRLSSGGQIILWLVAG